MDDARRYHHGDLKNALVAAGMEILETDGLAGLSLRAIAARVGVSHAAPRNHFGTLKGLLTAIAAEGFRRHAAMMRDGLPEGAPRVDRLAAAMQGYVRFAAEHPALFALMFSPLHCTQDDPALHAAAGESYAVLREISAGLEWDKADAPEGERRTEWMLWSLVHGYATLAGAGMFKGDPGGRPALPIEAIMPGFGYRDG
ncbi:MAG: TetR/AcrR family transcriptional regulator [Gemmobacter sp.]